MISIIDYDAGNIHSVSQAVRYLGEDPVLTSDRDGILRSSHVILPGVGSFGHAMRSLEERGLVPVIREAVAEGIPFLGICLGMQVLFEESEESPGVRGLGLLPGRNLRFPEKEGFKIPHMGWNTLEYGKEGKLFEGIGTDPAVYFVHSYYVSSDDPGVVTARCTYTAAAGVSVEKGLLFECQCHAEKSGRTGLAILRNFLKTGKEVASC